MPENGNKKSSPLASNIKPFLIRGLLLLVGWKLLYNLLLQPIGIPDNQLTKITENAAAWLLSFFYPDIYQYNHTIYLNKIATVIIAPQCNGLELIVLYVGFILCIPTNFKRMFLFSTIGTAIIFVLNVMRSAILAVMYLKHYYLIDFAHHYAFKLIIYAVVFYGWVLYAKKPGEK